MNLTDFDIIHAGDCVRVRKSGKLYRCLHVATDGRREFRQIRANSAGVVGLYGPSFVRLKPENVDFVPRDATRDRNWPEWQT